MQSAHKSVDSSKKGVTMENKIVTATVVLLIDTKGRVCLARKKQPIHRDGGEISYSLGMYNGYGGKSEEVDHTIFDTAVRELYDESGVKASPSDLEHTAQVHFYIKKENEIVEPFMEVSFFFLRRWQGTPKEGEEMGVPTFFEEDSIPYDEMMPADKVLFEKMFKGERGVYEVKLLGKKVKPEITLLYELP